MDDVNGTGGAAACESGGIARPGGAIPGARVGGGANTSPCTGGAIPGAEVGEGTVARACKENAGPGSVIPECSMVRGGVSVWVNDLKCRDLCLITVSHYHRGLDGWAGIPDPFNKECDNLGCCA